MTVDRGAAEEEGSAQHDADADAEEARWRQRDKVFVQQQLEGALRMKSHIGARGRELDTEYAPHLHAARDAAPRPGQAEVTALPG